MASIMEEFKHLEVQLEDIKSATDNFSKNKVIGSGGFGDVYEGQMSHSKGKSMVAIKRLIRRHGQGDPEFLKEIATLSRYAHKNLISLLGFCDHGDEKILVYEHAARGSLDLHLSSPALTWTRRIKICLDAAKGLSYLHDPRETHQRVLHRDIKSSNILLDANWNAKVSDMGLSKMGPANQPYTALFTNVAGTPGYCDPQYFKTYILTKESDVYSFGVVLFEVLCGKLCYKNSNRQFEILVPKWKQSYQEEKLDTIIFQGLVQPMDPNSLKIFSDIAFQCLQRSHERPTLSLIVEKLEIALGFQEPHDLTMQNEEITPLTSYRSIEEPKQLLFKGRMPPFMKEFEHLEIPLERIISATHNFDTTKCIGSSVFGNVYEGEVSNHSMGQSMVAIKRLDRNHDGQVDPRFFENIMMLSRYMHQNLISFLGFSAEGGEKILVYEHASNGSLDQHLSSTALTWTQRIKICLDAARGISYLHGEKGTQQRTLHRNIKSSNILLDGNWNAKVSDSRLSKIGHASQKIGHASIMDNIGYLDPMYMQRGILSFSSDVYSFGVVLLEVLCGRLCFQNNNGISLILVQKWKHSYKNKELDDIIFQDLEQPLDPTSLETFSNIAFQCVTKHLEERPTMSVVVDKLKIALEFQELFDLKLRQYEEISKVAVTPLRHRSAVEQNELLANGVYLYGGKTWFSLNKHGENCEMISVADCLILDTNEHHIPQYSFHYNSRFPVGCYETYGKKFKTRIKAQFLSPQTTYTVNFVFKFKNGNKQSKEQYIALRYSLEGDTKTSISYLADEREDEWLMAELYEFTSNGTTVDLQINFEYNKEWLVVEGIEFRPVDRYQKGDMQTQSDSDSDTDIYEDRYWEKKLPNDYQNIIKMSKYGLKYWSMRELYSIFCKGFEINNGQEWFFLGKKGKKCLMLSPSATRVISIAPDPTWQSSPESRFGEALEIKYDIFLRLHGDIKSCVLSSETTYASYLVYKLPEDQPNCEAPVEVRYEDIVGSDNGKKGNSWYIYLASPKTPVIAGGKVDQNAYNPLNRPKIEGIPQERSDGWMEVQVWEFRTTSTTKKIGSTKKIHMRLSLTSRSPLWLHGLIVHGIEFRPKEYKEDSEHTRIPIAEAEAEAVNRSLYHRSRNIFRIKNRFEPAGQPVEPASPHSTGCLFPVF